MSAAIQQLEAQLGVRLLHRTTRQVRLTPDGEQLLSRVRPVLCNVEDIDQLFQASQRQVSGRLIIDVPSRIARRVIAPALPGLLRCHPLLQLILGSTDRSYSTDIGPSAMHRRSRARNCLGNTCPATAACSGSTCRAG